MVSASWIGFASFDEGRLIEALVLLGCSSDEVLDDRVVVTHFVHLDA